MKFLFDYMVMASCFPSVSWGRSFVQPTAFFVCGLLILVNHMNRTKDEYILIKFIYNIHNFLTETYL